MKILVTGSNGFVGKNLCMAIKNVIGGFDKRYNFGELSLYEYDIDKTLSDLEKYTEDCDFVFNLAGVNRPKDNNEFTKGNVDFLDSLLNCLKKHGNKAPVMMSSSVQAELDNPYGQSKLEGEKRLRKYGEENGVKTLIYRFPNLFGKWCRPNYNSAVATFSNNIANDLPIQVNNRETCLNLVYIDDLVEELFNALQCKEHRDGDFCFVPTVYRKTLGEIVDKLYYFKTISKTLEIPDMSDGFTVKLYATYLSYLPKENICYDLKMNIDDRGSFTEMIRTFDRGQVSVNISKPHIVKGNHWHNTKNEKFIVVSGKGVIRMRHVLSDEVFTYYVDGEHIKVVDIPTGFTHNIENIGETDMITVMWASECFNPEKPDTFYLKV